MNYFVIIAVWLCAGLYSVHCFVDFEYSKNPFKNLWIRYGLENYNVVGKIILIMGHCIIGFPDIIIAYLIMGVAALGDLALELFDKIFKEK